MKIRQWFDGLRAPVAQKASRAGPMVAVSSLGRPKWTPRRYDALAEAGYRRNVIVYRCVTEIAKTAASIPWVLYDRRGREIGDHPLLDLLSWPNPGQGGHQFFEMVYSWLQLAGNSYIEAVSPDPGTPPRELFSLRPDRMKVIPGAVGLPAGYEYSLGGQGVRWDVDPLDGSSPILHWKCFHPLDDWYGLAPLEAALTSVDQHNAAADWNQSLLSHGARPSGALVYAPKDGPANLSDDQFHRLKEELEGQYQGSRNSGRPLILEGGLDWREMSLSPKDMDWLRGRDVSARDIALAFGVPAQLVGIADSQTYANMAEARLAFYEQTVLPLAEQLCAELNNWLVPLFGDGVWLDLDLDEVSALSPRRDAMWAKIAGADFLTPNEKRDAVGYGPVEGGDTLPTASPLAGLFGGAKFNPNHAPAGGPGPGQFISAPGGGGATVEDGPAHHPHGDTTDDPADSHQRHLDVDGAVKDLHEKVDDLAKKKPHGIGACARYVRDSLKDGGGIDIGRPPKRPEFNEPVARDYGQRLEKSGFDPVFKTSSGQTDPLKGYTPQTGDVVVIQPATGHPKGHMAMYDGTQWVSDFRQHSYWPGSTYQAEHPSSVIYRYPRLKKKLEVST
jgi:HK97 family phage portal protein